MKSMWSSAPETFHPSHEQEDGGASEDFLIINRLSVTPLIASHALLSEAAAFVPPDVNVQQIAARRPVREFCTSCCSLID